MKKKIIKIICLVFFVVVSVFARAQEDACLLWTKSIGAAGYDGGKCIAMDAGGNIYACGIFSNTVDFDPGPSVFNLISSGGTDVFITKYNAAGTFMWAKKIGGTASEWAYNILIDASGNIILGGYFQGVSDFDPGTSVYNLTSAGNADGFVLMLDASGNFSWAVGFGSTLDDEVRSITLDGAGNIHATGLFRNTVDFDPGPAIYNLTSSGLQDVFILKLTSTGAFVWAKDMGGSNTDVPWAIAIDGAGAIYTYGQYVGTSDFDPGPSSYTLASFSATNTDVFISKLDASGNFLWAKGIGSASAVTNRLVFDASGNLVVAGYFFNTVDFDPGVGVYNLTSLSANGFVLKLDANGSFIFAKGFFGTGNATAYSLNTDAAGNIYTVGNYSGGSVDFDPGPAVYSFSSSIQTGYLNKLDINGNLIWNKVIVSSSNNNVQDLVVDAASNIYFTGQYSGVADLNPGPTVTNYTAAGVYDIFIEKLGQASAPVITNSGPTTFCQGSNIILTSSSAPSYTWSNGSNTQSISVTTTGNYSVGITNNGCTLYSSVTPAFASPAPTITVNSGSICAGNSFTINPSGAQTYTISGGSSIVSPSSTSTYSIIGTSSIGCISSGPAISTVVVNALPLPTVTINSGSVCAGNSFTITPSGAQTYTISGNIYVVTPSITTSYSVVGTSINGCKSSQVVSTVTVSSSPLPTLSVNSGSICAGQSFTINPLGANTYTITGGTAIVSPSMTSTYSITGTSSAGCVALNNVVATVSVSANPSVSVTSGTICAGNSFTINPSGANNYTIEGGSAIVSPTANTTYSIVGTSTAGCISLPVNLTITVNPLPIVSANNGTICQGQSFNLAPSGAAVYTISGGLQIVSPLISTSYSITGSSAGCVSAAPFIATVTVFSLPSFSITSSSNLICSGNAAILTIGGSTGTYTWNSGSTALTQTISPTATTVYSMTGTDTNGCVAMASYTQNVSQCVGIKTPDQISEPIVIYPNPSNGKFMVELKQPGIIQLYDLSGMVLQTQKIESKAVISISEFANGLYLLKLTTESDNVFYKKIIKSQ